MKGIKLCGECGNYDYKKHRCRIGCKDDSDAQAPFYCDCPLPDVVPKSEYDAVVSAVDNSTKEFLKLHDDYQEAKSEVEYWKQQYFHSCVSNGCVDEKVIEYLRTNAEGHNDPVGEDGVDGLESAITQAKAEVAREIFEDLTLKAPFFCENQIAYDHFNEELAELKKKYTEVEDDRNSEG